MNDELNPDGTGESTETEWPEYQIPTLGGDTPAAPADAAPAASAGAAAEDPAQPSVDPQAPPAAPAEPSADPILTHPAVQAVLSTLQTQNAALQAALRAARREEPAAPKTPVEERPEEDIALENRMLERVPFLRALKTLVESPNFQHLTQLTKNAPHFNETVQQFQHQVATSAFERIPVLFAERRGVDPKTVSDADSRALAETFLTRLGNDLERQRRFNAGDLRVVDEIMEQEFTRWGLAPAAAAAAPAPGAPPAPSPVAATAATVAARVARASKLPPGGGNALPAPSSTTPKVNLDDEDSVHDAAWKHAQAALM